jgi:CheY-like chemotaxis protein
MEAIGRLAGGVAHDFNNLLTAITGNAQLLRDGLEASDPRASDVTEILDASDRASALTRQLLAFSRRQVLQPEVICLNETVRGLERMLGRLIGEDVELRSYLATDLGYVRADPGQVTQVILNLALNARDAMPSGGTLLLETANVTLDETYVSHHPGVAPGPHVMLAVTDTGVGMDQETRQHLFEPFFTTKTVGRGTGLGLATVYGIVQQSGGSIWVYSEPGHGTSFKLYFPRVNDAAPKAAEPACADVGEGRETILVVEDETSVRRLVTTVLGRHGYEVLEAGRAADGLNVAAAFGGPIHLLITDVIMPGGNGADLAIQFAAVRPEARILFMSGYTQDAIVHHGVLDEGIAFLEKPFSPEALLARVRSVLGAPAQG